MREAEEISAVDETGLKGRRRRPSKERPADAGAGKMGEEQDDGEEEGKKGKDPTVPFHMLFKFADSKDALLMLLGTVGAVANGASLPLMTVLFGDIMDSFGKNANEHDVLREVSKVCLQFVYLAVGTAIASFFQVACWMVTGERQAARIRHMYLRGILRQEVSFFDRETSTGEVIGRMSGDTALIQDAMGEKVGKFIQLFATFIGGFIVAFVRGWLLTLVMLSTLLPLIIASSLMATVMTKMSTKGQKAYAEASVIVDQTIGAIRTVASFTGEKRALEKYVKSLRTAYKASIIEGAALGAGYGTVIVIMFCGYALGVWYGAKLILNKGYTGGKIMTVIFAILTASFSLGQTSPPISAFVAGKAAAYKMFETIRRKPEIDAYKDGKKLDDIQGDIELKDVYFSYPTRPDEQIFCGFSLIIKSGLSIALVGESGSGKSTVISLIERFYDPQSGEVLIDGVNIKELQLRWVRSKIGLVSQEPVLFSSSIKDNIAYGKEGASIEEIRAAAELANASKFIDKMPQGLDTMVGEHGTQLSGGQKQRIAIARAILKDPRILLLDEATSALDTESELVVQEALDRVMTNRTTVMIAHRLTTVRNADMIAVIHRGVIVEKGPHVELIEDPNGAYSQLIRLQEMKKDMPAASEIKSDRHSLEISRPSSIPNSLQQSISRGSSTGNSSRHSFSMQFGAPKGLGIVESTVRDPDTKGSEENTPEVPLSRVASLNKPEIPAIIIGTLAAIVCGGIMPTFGLILSKIINTFYEQSPNKLKKDSQFWALMFIVIGVIGQLSYPVRSYFFAIAGSSLVRRIRIMCFEKVMRMEISWFDHSENSSGAVGARLNVDATSVRGLVGDSLAVNVENVASLIAGLIIAFLANWQLSLIILALVPFIGLNGFIQMQFLKGFGKNVKKQYEEASQVASDAVGSIRTVASFSAEDKVITLYKQKCDGPIKDGVRQGLISGTGFGISFFLLYCVYATVFYAGAKLVADGKTTFDEVFRVFFALTMAAIGISQTSALAPDASKAKLAAASIFSILDRKSLIDPNDDSGDVLKQVQGNIEFKHISFHYPTRPDIQIFQDLCFHAQSGKTLALVGESGCGKSTVIALLERFYNPDSGHIYLDGKDMQTLRLSWLRQQMGLVSQEPVLFNDTIRANIAYGKDGEASEAEIIAAAELANAHRFISALQQGYDTIVGERGIQLSGGQKQRVAIARAMVKDPRILLLDEATSALDAESERIVQDALDRVMVNRTTIVIAHRLSTIKGADQIAVVKNGVIVEKGKHDSLIKMKDGAYASLVALHGSTSH